MHHSRTASAGRPAGRGDRQARAAHQGRGMCRMQPLCAGLSRTWMHHYGGDSNLESSTLMAPVAGSEKQEPELRCQRVDGRTAHALGVMPEALEHLNWSEPY